MKMKAGYSSETSVPINQPTRRHNPENSTLDSHSGENLRFDAFSYYFSFSYQLQLFHSVRYEMSAKLLEL
jgi:hypothetical protein